MKIKCFISHTWKSGQDDFAQYLSKRLQRFSEIDVWIDTANLDIGDRIGDVISRAIETQCDLTLCVLSPEYIESEYCKYELEMAARLSRENRHRIIPLLLSDCIIPLPLEGLLWGDFRNAWPLTTRAKKTAFDGTLHRLITSIKKTGTRMRRVIRLGIIRNSNASYCNQVASGFLTEATRLLQAKGYEPHIEEEIGNATVEGEKKNAAAFNSLLKRLQEGCPRFLVTIGSGVTKYAIQHFLGTIPILFLGVTEPVEFGLLPSSDSNDTRRELTGIGYSLFVKERLKFLSELFPRKRIGFIYSDEIEVDFMVYDLLQRTMNEISYEITIIPIKVKQQSINQQQMKQADLFMGWLYVHTHLDKFLRSCDKPFIGGGLPDVRKGAIAALANADREVGESGATLLYTALVKSRSLSEIPIQLTSKYMKYVNRSMLDRYGMKLSDEQLRRMKVDVIE
jgi:ABC-type uncharacterized transport system substrate-binding protein